MTVRICMAYKLHSNTFHVKDCHLHNEAQRQIYFRSNHESKRDVKKLKILLALWSFPQHSERKRVKFGVLQNRKK